MNGVRNHSESDSEIYRLSPVVSLTRSSHNFFRTGDHSEIIYLGNEEPDGCSTAEETILVVPNSKKGEVGTSNDMHREVNHSFFYQNIFGVLVTVFGVIHHF